MISFLKKKQWYLIFVYTPTYFCDFFFSKQLQSVVKVHGVFPSSHRKPASAQVFQLHWICVGDSGEIVTPFMHVGTYPTRNFATFGPSELRPPFTDALNQCLHISFKLISTGQVSDPILHFTILQSLVFLLNSRPPFFNALLKHN